MSKRIYSIEYKLEILKMCEERHHSMNELASMYNVDWSTIDDMEIQF